MKQLEYRMYGLVPYNISPIQQGIQFGHAVVEYSLNYPNDKTYADWAHNWKTFIILNGGTTNSNMMCLGSLNKHAITLNELGVKTACFYEPDLGDQLTAVVFLVDERIFNTTLYPMPIDPLSSEWSWTDNLSNEELSTIIQIRDFLKQFKLA